jgi:hypothetical protein
VDSKIFGGGIIAGGFLLILIYLLVANGDKTVAIFSTIGSNAIGGIKAFQGR